MNSIRKLLILGRVTHYRYQGRLYAYTPYAKEIDVWARLFPEVVIASTCREEPPKGDCCPFLQPNISIRPVAEAGGQGIKAKLMQAWRLPQIIWQVVRPMFGVDAIHVRGPSDLGLLGTIFAPLFRRPLIAKYATHWQAFENEPFFWRLHRALLKSSWWRGPVTVYGRWPNQPPHVIPFFTSMLSEAQMDQARRAAAGRRRWENDIEVLFVGRLSKNKNVDVLLRALALAEVPHRRFACTIVGEGPERAALEKLAGSLGLQQCVTFTGGLSYEEVLGHYARANVLVLASNIEGWPKAVAEAMAFGAVCIGSAVGMMPQMLAEGRGVLVPPGDEKALQEALEQTARDPEAAIMMGKRAAAWAQQFTLEGLGERIRQQLMRDWATSLPPLGTAKLQPQEAL